jgi:transposase
LQVTDGTDKEPKSSTEENTRTLDAAPCRGCATAALRSNGIEKLAEEMNRLKALYRGWGIACSGTQVYAARYREEWLYKIPHAGVHRRAELLYQQLDGLQALRRTLRPELLAESRKHKAAKLLRQIPCIGPIRAARLLALMQTPHRFRSKRQLWTYSGLGIETHDSAQYRYVRGHCNARKNHNRFVV